MFGILGTDRKLTALLIPTLIRTVSQSHHTGRCNAQRRAAMGRWGGFSLWPGTAIPDGSLGKNMPFQPVADALLIQRQNPTQSVHDAPGAGAGDARHGGNFSRRGRRAGRQLPHNDTDSLSRTKIAFGHGFRIPYLVAENAMACGFVGNRIQCFQTSGASICRSSTRRPYLSKGATLRQGINRIGGLGKVQRPSGRRWRALRVSLPARVTLINRWAFLISWR